MSNTPLDQNRGCLFFIDFIVKAMVFVLGLFVACGGKTNSDKED